MKRGALYVIHADSLNAAREEKIQAEILTCGDCFLKDLIFGFIIGVANIIPGVSGGTFALILGIYPKLLKAIGDYDAGFFKTCLVLAKKKEVKKIQKLIFTENFFFLLKLLVGALISLVLLSKLFKFLLENQYEITYGFFLGLIVFSIYIPYKLLDSKRLKYFIWLFVGLGITLFISANVDPSIKMLEKSLYYKNILDGVVAASGAGYSILEYMGTFCVGMLAISAMALPGISGSFVLLLFGKYYQVISSLSRLQKFYIEDFAFISVFSAGCLVGLVVFVKLFNFVYNRFKDQTILFLIGLMCGSVYALWPFKKYQFVDLYIKINKVIFKVPNYKIYSNNLKLYDNFQQLWPVLSSFAAGALIMLFFTWYESTKNARIQQ